MRYTYHEFAYMEFNEDGIIQKIKNGSTLKAIINFVRNLFLNITGKINKLNIDELIEEAKKRGEWDMSGEEYYPITCNFNLDIGLLSQYILPEINVATNVCIELKKLTNPADAQKVTDILTNTPTQKTPEEFSEEMRKKLGLKLDNEDDYVGSLMTFSNTTEFINYITEKKALVDKALDEIKNKIEIPYTKAIEEIDNTVCNCSALNMENNPASSIAFRQIISSASTRQSAYTKYISIYLKMLESLESEHIYYLLRAYLDGKRKKAAITTASTDGSEEVATESVFCNIRFA